MAMAMAMASRTMQLGLSSSIFVSHGRSNIASLSSKHHVSCIGLCRFVNSPVRRWSVATVSHWCEVKVSRESRQRVCVAAASGGAGEASFEGSDELGSSPTEATSPQEQEERRTSLTSWWKNWQTNASEMRAQVAKLGLAAVLAYGIFDGVTYTSFFVLAFLGYEKSTGLNPAANLKALLGIVVLMWTGNNVTRPFRVAGAAAFAPLIDKFLKKTQAVLKLPNQAFAFMVVVASFASLCFSVVGVLILSRWGK